MTTQNPKECIQADPGKSRSLLSSRPQHPTLPVFFLLRIRRFRDGSSSFAFIASHQLEFWENPLCRSTTTRSRFLVEDSPIDYGLVRRQFEGSANGNALEIFCWSRSIQLQWFQDTSTRCSRPSQNPVARHRSAVPRLCRADKGIFWHKQA